MDTPEKRKQLEAMAEEIFALRQLSSLARARAERGNDADSLTETEFLTLDLLAKNEQMTVGEIQKSIGVLPAQMSRIIRALEDKGGAAYIQCQINPEDRRKIDVTLTNEGRKAFTGYRSARLGATVKILSALSQPERDDFIRIMRRIRELISNAILNK